MIPLIVTFETAHLANEKGFDHPVPDVWNFHGNRKEPKLCHYDECDFDIHDLELPKHEIYAPDQALLQGWLRGKHGFELFLSLRYKGKKHNYKKIGYDVRITNRFMKDFEFGKWFYCYDHDGEMEIYEDALEKGLLEALKLIK